MMKELQAQSYIGKCLKLTGILTFIVCLFFAELVNGQGPQILSSALNEVNLMQEETISGTVRDAETGETIPGVNIRVEDTDTGTSTNADGKFELTVPDL